MKSIPAAFISVLAIAPLAGCSAANPGVAGPHTVGHPDVPGTVFTIVFENEDANRVIAPKNPTFYRLANEFGRPYAYVSRTHPSLPNYIMLTSGTLNGVTTDDDPESNVRIPGSANLADQLDAAHVPWRAYMESMGEPCNAQSDTLYSAHHDPFLYYRSMIADKARCTEKVVDFAAHFSEDLASDRYRYMWITPNMCNDVHDCSTETGDAWLEKVTSEIMASPGYKNGGAIFILFDEGSFRLFGAAADLPVIVVSPNLASMPYVSDTALDHASYLATVEDILGLPRLATTVDATTMDDFFFDKSQGGAAGGSASTP